MVSQLFKPPPFKAGAKYRITNPDGTIRDVVLVTSREVTDIQIAGGNVQFIPVDQRVALPPPDISLFDPFKVERDRFEISLVERDRFDIQAARQAGISDELITQFFGEDVLRGIVEAEELRSQQLSQFEPFKTPEGLYDIRAARAAGVSEEDITAVFGEQPLLGQVTLEEPLGEQPPEPRDVDLLYIEYQRTGGTLNFFDWQLAGTPLRPGAEVSVTGAISTVFPERIQEGVAPEDAIAEFITSSQEQPQDFLMELVSRGRTPEVETLINTFFDVQPGDIDRLFGELGVTEPLPPFEGQFEITPMQQLLVNALPLLVRPPSAEGVGTLQAATELYANDPERLRRNLITAGRSEDTEALVKALYPQITDQGMADYFNERVPGTVEGVPSEALGTLPTLTWLDRVQELKDNPEQLVPFVAGAAEMVKLGQLLLIAKDLEDGKTVSQEDLLILKSYVDRSIQDKTWGFQVADVVSQLVPFAGEFIATGGIFSAGKTVAVKAAEQALKRIATRTGLRILQGRLAKFGVEVAGVVGGGTLRTIPAGITRIPAATLEKQLTATLTGDEEAVLESAVKAFGEQWVEIVSESTGGLFATLAAPIKGQLIKAGLFKAFIKANPTANPSNVRRVFDRLGYNGVLAEMLEERVADVGHGILEPLGLSDQAFSIPSLEQLSVELAAFSVPGAAATAIQTAPLIFEKLTPKIKKAISNIAEEVRLRPERGAVGGEAEEVTPEEVEPTEPVVEPVFKEGDILINEEGKEVTLEKFLPDAGVTEKGKFLVRDVRGTTSQLNTSELVERGFKHIAPEVEEIVPEVARQEPGAPEAGIQPSLIEGVPAEEVRPRGRAEIVQISMDDQLKLRQAREAAEEAPEGAKEAYEAQQEITGLEISHKTDPVAQTRVKLGNRNVGLDAFVSIREQDFPEYFTVKQATALRRGDVPVAGIIQTGRQQGKVPRDVALDELTKELNMTPDEIANRVMALRQEKRRIKDLQATIKAQMVETPLPVVTELTTGEVTENWETIGQPKLTLKQAQALTGVMGDYVLSGDALDAFQVQRALWSRTRTGQAEDFKALMNELVVVQGVGVEEAFRQAASVSFAGKLPVVRTNFFEAMSAEMRSAFFTVVFHNKQLQAYPFEMASTITAMTNALDGKPIPRKKGTGSVLFPEGGSAWDRINFVFGKQPKVLKAIEKMADERKPLKDEIVEGVFHETGREPIPIDQETADYLRNLSAIPFGYKTTFEPGFNYPIVNDLRHPAEAEFAKEKLDLSIQLSEGKIDLNTYNIEVSEARDKHFPPPPVPQFDAPIKEAYKIKPLFNFLEQSTFNRVLKEIGMAPLDIGNFLRANKASFDNSFLRQSKMLAAGNPIIGWQGHATAWQNMFSQKHTEAEWELITRDPDFHIFDQIRVDTGHDPLRVPAFAATKGTEQYRTSEEFGFTRQDVERAIPKFTAWLPHVRYSERAFSGGTNKIVWLIWKKHLAWSRRYSEKIASGDVVLKEGEAFDIIQEMTDVQSMLGDLIQRANLRRFSGLAPAMNAFFFAARSKIGRLLLPKHLIGFTIRNGKVGFNPRVMREAWKDLISWTGYISGIMFLGDWLDLWELEKDPRNAEFMSARIGNTRIDPWAGYRQFAVLYARLVTGTGISSVTGAEYDVDPIRAGQSFVTNSLSPLASILLEFWTGRNFLGQVIEYDDARYWIEKMTPFSIDDVWEAAEEDWRVGIAVTIPAVYGEGVQTYTGDWEENFPNLGLPKYVENTAYGLSEPYYDTADFWSDTAKQFKGVDPETLTPAKGFPPYIKAIAEARLINEHLATLPSDRLVNLNAVPAQGTTFTQYHQMWLDREKLVAAGDDAEITIEGETFKGEEAVEAFDKDERTKNAQQGNFSQRQFALLNQYWSITNKKEQAEFLEEHKAEIGVNPRQDWLRKHPKENAELAIWGQAKVLTKEAYDHFKTLAKKFDIPDTAVPELLLPPETSIDTHFDYEEMVSEGTHGSDEAKLLLLKDQIAADEAGEKSYVGWRNDTNQPLKLPAEQLEYYQLKVDNRQNYDDLEEAQAADDEDEVEEIRARKVDGETFHDVERRVDAIGKGTREVPIEPEIVNDVVAHMQIVDETGSGLSAESKLNRYDNPDLNAFLMNDDYHGTQAAKPLDDDKEYLDNYLVPRWRIDVKYRTEDDEYDALLTTSERQQYLLDNEGYRMGRRRREALSMSNKTTGDRFPLEQVENFVNYHEIEVKGKRQERFLVNNPDFAKAMHNIGGIDIPLPQDVPAVQFDDIYDEFEDQFLQLEGFADNQSEHYIEFPEEGLTLVQTREKARDAIRFDAQGKYTEFGLAELERNAYGKFVPENFVIDYVGYYTIIGEGRPDNYEEVNKTDLWYEDDWFFMENPEFYQQVYRELLGNEAKKFSKVPSREVFAKYLDYLKIDSRQAKLRDDFRWNNLDLDDWLVLKFDYTSVVTKRRRAALTTGERLAESIAELERRLREHP